MKLIYRTTSREFSGAVRAAFEHEGIAHFVSDPLEGLAIGGAATLGISVFVMHEHDEARALEILAELGAFDEPPRRPASEQHTLPRWVWFALAMGAAMVVGAVLTS